MNPRILLLALAALLLAMVPLRPADAGELTATSEVPERTSSSSSRIDDHSAFRVAFGHQWLGFHLEDLSLGLLEWGHTLSVFPTRWLSVDTHLRVSQISLVEMVGGEARRTVRTLPEAGIGVSARGSRGRVRPFGGVDVTLTAYAMRTRPDTGTRAPLVGPSICARGGVEFRFDEVIGVYVRGRAGVLIWPAVQTAVNSDWSVVSPVVSVGSGLFVRLPQPTRGAPDRWDDGSGYLAARAE